MRNSELLLVLAVMFMSGSAQATLATCPACSGDQADWTESATSFLEGKPIQDAPSTLGSPQQARLLNAQIDARKKASEDSNAANNIAVTPVHSSTPMFDIHLKDVHAVSNPTKFNDSVKIVAVFGNISSNLTTRDSLSKGADLTSLMVYAEIKNSAGLDIGRVNLKRSSDTEYSGIWNVSVGSGTYNATIEATGPDRSKVFNDALQIIVRGIPE
jgi:hypothetical protein